MNTAASAQAGSEKTGLETQALGDGHFPDQNARTIKREHD